MATELKEIRDFVRTVLGDSDAQRLLYADATIDSHIKLLIIKEDDPEIQVGAVGYFATDLTANQKALTVYKTARSILSPQPDKFSYRSPVMAVSRSGGVMQMLAHIERNIADLEGGVLKLAVDTELDAMVNGGYRFINDMQAAQTNL